MEKRYATLGTRQRRDRAENEDRQEPLSPLLEIARHDERHHYGRHSVERRQERLSEQRRPREPSRERGAKREAERWSSSYEDVY